MAKKLVYLNILDGFGLEKDDKSAIYAAIKQGKAPYFKELFDKYPYAILEASGEAVGLPAGTMGNSEVNHLNMGAGRVVYQSLLRVNKAIESGEFFKNAELLKAIENVKKNNSTLHLMGILQGGGGCVHGNIEHVFGLLSLVKKNNVSKAMLHLFTDGRDTDIHAAGSEYLPQLQKKIKELGLLDSVSFGSVMGRAYAMDRDTTWDKTLTAIKTLVLGQGLRQKKTIDEALAFAYEQSVKLNDKVVRESDEFIQPTVIGGFKGIGPKDSVIFWNFRQDRGIQLTVAFTEKDEKFFNYKKGTSPIDEKIYRELQAIRDKVKGITFITMTEYYEGQKALAAFPEREVPDTVGEIVSKAGLKQLRLAGPEKFVHVTGWFSGRRSTPFSGEDRYLAQDATLKKRTNQGANYDWVPEMTAYLETDFALKAVDSGEYSLIVHNFQNLDMIGHTGNFEAAVAAVSQLSACVEKLVRGVLARGGIYMLTADHGNADMMINDQGKPSTIHSLNPVPLWILGYKGDFRKKGIIPDIGPTVLKLLDLEIPKDMTAKSLIH